MNYESLKFVSNFFSSVQEQENTKNHIFVKIYTALNWTEYLSEQGNT